MSRIDDPGPRVAELKAMGMSDGVILNRLRLEGWSSEALTDVFAPKQTAPANAAPAKPLLLAQRRQFPLIAATLALFIAGAASTSLYLFYKPPTVYSSSLPASVASASTSVQSIASDATTTSSIATYALATSSSSFTYQLNPPAVSAAEYLVADMGNAAVLASKNTTQPAPIASISKLVTALVVADQISLDKMITVPQSAMVYTTIPRLRAGSSVRAYDLLFLLLQESSNEAAEVLASSVGRLQFVSDMNDKARAMGLEHTLFTDPSGAKSDLSTPEDLFTLLRYVNDHHQFIFGITSGDLTDNAYGPPVFHNIRDFNVIKNSPATLLGGKIGQTNEAGETYAGIFEVTIGKQKRDIAVIVLGSTNVQDDVKKLLTFVHNSYAPAEQ